MNVYKSRSCLTTVKPFKTATPWGMKKWPSYRGGCLMEVILLKILRVTYIWGMKKWPSYRGGRLIGGRLERFYCTTPKKTLKKNAKKTPL